MRKIAGVLILTLALGGCAEFNKLFSSAPNPLTKTRLAEIEQGYGIASRLGLAYRNGCAKAPDVACRQIVRIIQNADNYAYNQILVARRAVKIQSLDAPSILTTAEDAVSALKQAESANGVR